MNVCDDGDGKEMYSRGFYLLFLFDWCKGVAVNGIPWGDIE